ncbi:MAG: hypothetical protein KC503_22115 [Myxococcales bacterium]|nr:hypothetical protein [Myxococcales bacterium]
MDDIVGWWAKPWIAVAVSAMLALGVYMALRVSQEAARGARYAAAVQRRARCPHRRDTARAYRTLYAKRSALEACAKVEKGAVWMRVQVDLTGAARIKGLRVDGRSGSKTLRSCLDKALGEIPFSRLTQSHPLNLSIALR